MHDFTPYLWLFPIGIMLGFLGTLIGAGGGFLLVPLLLLCYPHESPAVVTSISLAVVGLNALSGSIAYARQKRIDYRAGVIFAAATVPGAIIAAWTVHYLPRGPFDLCFGLTVCAVAVYLLWRPRPTAIDPRSNSSVPHPASDSHPPRPMLLGVAISLAVGFVSTFLGIGGGIVHVPALVHLLAFPVHTATATSHFILVITASAGTAVHFLTGVFHRGLRRTLVLGLGAVLGAPFGAALSRRIHENWIIRALASALLLVGVRLIWLGATR